MGRISDSILVIEPQVGLMRYFHVIQRRYKTLVLTRDPQSVREAEQSYNSNPWVARSESCIDEFISYDSVDVPSIIRALRPFEAQLAGIIGGDDASVPLAEQIGYALGFDYARPADAECHHLKTAMKRRLFERGVRTPGFEIVRDLESARRAWQRFGRNSMVKTVDLSGSFNIFRVRTDGELESAWDAITQNKVKTVFTRSKEVIIEEFIGGRELSIEGYTQGDRIEILNFSQKFTESNFAVVGHYIPADLTIAEEQALSGIACECVRALGLRNSVFHIEVHLQDGALYIIECAVRPPGQHTVDLIGECYGIDLMEISIDLAVGREVEARRREPRGHYGIFSLYTNKSGLLEQIEGLEELQASGAIMHLNVEVKPGDPVEAFHISKRDYGLIMLRDSSPEALRQKAEWFRKRVNFVVQTPGSTCTDHTIR